MGNKKPIVTSSTNSTKVYTSAPKKGTKTGGCGCGKSLPKK